MLYLLYAVDKCPAKNNGRVKASSVLTKERPKRNKNNKVTILTQTSIYILL